MVIIMNKKGVELALNTIIISIILLVVMVVLLLIFTGVWRGADIPGFVKCDNRIGGDWSCVSEGDSDGMFCTPGGGCEDPLPVCCRKEANNP